jgi:(5-formylfuran-3-yl)methyl phosphate synthase
MSAMKTGPAARLLVSVTSAAEAELALGAGADIVDLKDPASGVLGALPPAIVRAAVERVGGRVPVSATAGDLPMQPAIVAAAAERVAALGVDFVKIGLFGGGDPGACLAALAAVAARGRRLVAVLFADARPDFALIERAREHGLAGVMLDTMDKSGGSLRVHLDDRDIADFVTRARKAGLISGLAGSLRVSDVVPLAAFAPDYLGFRGALCRRGRTTALDPQRVRAVRSALQDAASSAATATAAAQHAAHSQVSDSPSTRLAKST